jgi:hypothetical protein
LKKYNLIYLRSNKLRLSRKQYSSWKEIQDEYNDYMTSLSFESLNDIINYLKLDYGLTLDKAKNEIKNLMILL